MKLKIIGSFSLGIIIPVAIIVPITVIAINKSKKALSSFIASGKDDPSLKWTKDTKLNYIAFGDSATAGYVGAADDDKVSYTDFIANNLRKAGKLKSYYNYANSGDTISKQKMKVIQNPDMKEKMENADLITFTIGANDLLSFVRMFGLPFNSSVEKIFNQEPILTSSDFRKDLPSLNGTLGVTNTNETISNEIRLYRWIEAITTMSDMFGKRDLSEFISIKKDNDGNDILPLLIKRNIALLMKELKAVAPNAKIIVLGHSMPFYQWPKEIIERKRKGFDNRTIVEWFNMILDKMGEGAKLTISGDSNDVDFYKIDNLKIVKSSAGDSIDSIKSIYKDYIKYGRLSSRKDHWKNNVMPNPTDIHPSVFGYELIGNSIFDKIAKKLKIKDEEIKKYYTYTDGGESGFESVVITNQKINDSQQLISLLSKDGDRFLKMREFFNEPITKQLVKSLILINKTNTSNIELKKELLKLKNDPILTSPKVKTKFNNIIKDDKLGDFKIVTLILEWLYKGILDPTGTLNILDIVGEEIKKYSWFPVVKRKLVQVINLVK